MPSELENRQGPRAGENEVLARGSALLTGSVQVLAGSVLARLTALVTSLIVVRLLSPSSVGTLYLTIGVVTLAVTVARFGMETASVRLIAEALAQDVPGRTKSVMRRSLALTCTTSIIVAAIGVGGGWHWLSLRAFHSSDMARLEYPATLLVLTLPLQGTAVGWYRGFADMRMVALFDEFLGAAAWCSALLATWIAVGHASTRFALEARGGAALAVLVVMGVGLARRFRLPGAVAGGSVSYRQLADLGWALMGATLIATIVGTTSDLLVLGGFRPPRDVAAYGVAAASATLVAIPFLAMTSALGPILAGMRAQGDGATMERLVRATGGPLLIASGVIALALSIPARRLLETVFGRSYGAGATVLVVLCAAQCAFVATGPCGLTLVMTGHHRPAFVLTAVAAVTSIAADVWAAPRYGATGVAVATSVVLTLDNVLTTLVAKRLVGIWTWPTFRRDDLRVLARLLLQGRRTRPPGTR